MPDNSQGIWIYIEGENVRIVVANGDQSVAIYRSKKEFVDMVRPLVMETPPCLD